MKNSGLYKFYSRSFPPNRFEENLFGQSYREFQKAIDMIFLLADTKSEERNFTKPMNIIVCETKSKIVIALNFDKAIITQTILSKSAVVFEDDKNIEKRLQRSLWTEYGMNVECFIRFNKSTFLESREWLINEFNKSDDFRDRINNIKGKRIPNNVIECCEAARSGMNRSKAILGGNGMWVNPKFQARDIVVNPNQCFYVMDFNDDNVKEAYNALTKELNDRLNVRVIKSGDLFDPNRKNEMVDNIWQDIVGSRLVITDISCKNPNVFYELGICDTVGKQVISICNKQSFSEDYHGKFPFDVQQEHTTIYENSYSGVKTMVEKVTKMVDAIINNKPTLM